MYVAEKGKGVSVGDTKRVSFACCHHFLGQGDSSTRWVCWSAQLADYLRSIGFKGIEGRAWVVIELCIGQTLKCRIEQACKQPTV